MPGPSAEVSTVAAGTSIVNVPEASQRSLGLPCTAELPERPHP